MQFSTLMTTLLALGTTSVLAAPAPAQDVSMMVANTQWTVESFKRVCASGDKSCNYTYKINLNDGSAARSCNYNLGGSPASRASYNNVKCGDFTISSSWSGQFGAGKGFQTLAAVRGRQIIYPAYTDTELAGGKVVSPNKKYTPQNI